MVGQRPKRNNSPINTKNQPLKATVPVSSLVRNPSPNRRRTSPSSPGFPPDKRNRIRKSPDVLSESRNLLSPLGSKELFKPVKKHIRRTNSLETLSSYMNGQWPREVVSDGSYVIKNAKNKATQTPCHWIETDDIPLYENIATINYDHRKSIATIGSKQIFRQVLQRSKQNSSQPAYGKQSPVHGNHSASITQHYFTPSPYNSSKPVCIPQVPSSPKYSTLHTRRSVEGLNFELEGLDLGNDYIFARTPPEGRRPPIPGLTIKNINTQTQTSNGWIDNAPLSPSEKDRRSRSVSPSWSSSPTEQKETFKDPPNPHRRTSIELYSKESLDISLRNSKNASSPKPNNSFWFSRGPPDGAEIPLCGEDIKKERNSISSNEFYSCPDVSKCTIQFSRDSPFCSLSTEL
ncbi:glucocorticoid-induced transcript 1 protein [Hydra vulgaris]|uniref:Glucocorticoid-induced transcript 1 protein n=1 Tax=Hydra vulgaris TaxID=6087 RepID=A0ABM4CWM7_HYDVU